MTATRNRFGKTWTGSCPSCDSPQPSMHPATQADGGEVLYICPDSWHDGDPVTEHARSLLAAKEASE